MTQEKIDLKKEEIQGLGLSAIKEYFEIDLSKLDKEILAHLHGRAKIGLSFEKEMNLSKRSVEMNYIRVFRMIAEDKEEIKKLIKKSIPNYLPE